MKTKSFVYKSIATVLLTAFSCAAMAHSITVSNLTSYTINVIRLDGSNQELHIGPNTYDKRIGIGGKYVLITTVPPAGISLAYSAAGACAEVQDAYNRDHGTHYDYVIRVNDGYRISFDSALFLKGICTKR
jgi:hypothetical protein